MKILIGDLNAQIGADRSGWEEVVGGMAKGERSDNGERLLYLRSSHGLKIGGSFFRHKDCTHVHPLTWTSPDGMTHTQINHICISGRWMSSLEDARAYRGAEVVSSDHHHIVAKSRSS